MDEQHLDLVPDAMVLPQLRRHMNIPNDLTGLDDEELDEVIETAQIGRAHV